MTPAQGLSTYRRLLAQRGQAVLLRRYVNVESLRVPVDCSVRVVVQDYAPDVLTGPLVQGERHVILLAEDVAQAVVINPDALPDDLPVAWPGPPRRGDKIVLGGKEINIEFVDDNSRRLADVLLAYVMQIKG